jgi:hypothetical protein
MKLDVKNLSSQGRYRIIAINEKDLFKATQEDKNYVKVKF